MLSITINMFCSASIQTNYINNLHDKFLNNNRCIFFFKQDLEWCKSILLLSFIKVLNLYFQLIQIPRDKTSYNLTQLAIIGRFLLIYLSYQQPSVIYCQKIQKKQGEEKPGIPAFRVFYFILFLICNDRSYIYSILRGRRDLKRPREKNRKELNHRLI